MSLYILWQNKDLPSPRVPWEPTDRGLESGQWDDSRSSGNTWPLKTVHTADFPEPKTFRNFCDQKGIAWFWRVGENCESFLVFRSLWVMVSLHVVLWCTSDFWVEFAHSNLPCFGARYIYMQENTLMEPTTSYKTEENGQVTPKKQQQTQVEVSEVYFYI